MEKLLRKPSCSMTGRTDTFAQLKSFLPRLLDTLDLKWMQSTQYLREQSHMSVN